MAVEALGDGSQTVLFRKGGIKEPLFRPEAPSFLLFPTAFHSEQQLLKPGVAGRYQEAMHFDPKAAPVLQLSYFAQLTGAWATYDAAVLQALDELHVWAPGFAETRLKWRKSQPITVMELRVWRLAAPLQLPLRDELFGCFSWVEVGGAAAALQGTPGGDLDLAGAVPVLGDEAFATRQQQLRSALKQVEAAPIDVAGRPAALAAMA